MNNTAQPNKPLVVVSSVSQDQDWLEAFRPHLDILGQYGEVDIWNESDIAAGSDRYRELDERMRSARIVICLISAHYLSSIRRFESFDYLLGQRQRGGLLLLPILVKPCPWQIVPWLKPIQMFPRDNQPVSTHYQGREDEVFTEVVLDVYERRQTFESVRSVEKTELTTTEAARQIVTAEVVLAPPPAVELPEDLRENIQRLPETGHKLFGRRRELAILDAIWASEATNMISLIAWGGVGKTTLVSRWLEQLRADGYRDARRVYAWSFFSQGTKQQVTSSDLFFDETLRWFGAQGFEQQSIWDKAELLAGLIRQEPTLLILDGVEPLQSGADFDRGVFRDGGLQWLLKELIRDNCGLCVVTSRVPLADYQDDITVVAAESPAINEDGTIDAYPDRAAVQVDLETISPEAGRDVLKTEFVQGTNAELAQATREFGCHALAVSLLGSWLHEISGHQISERDRIPGLDLSEEEGRHARRVLAAFEDLLGESAELELLRIMGLFDRPAQRNLVEAVLDGETIEGLTSHYGEDFRTTLASSLVELRRLRLLAPASKHRPDDIDCHPLIREHFAAQLEQRLPAAAREAHRRLYEHLKQSAPERPDNLNDMMPLYHAVAHGCRAGFVNDAYYDVFDARIRRKDEGFSFRKLGAFGTDLAAISSFFDEPWSRPSPQFSTDRQAYVLNEAGFALRGLGRLEESRAPLDSSVSIYEGESNWESAAICTSNLSELSLTLGDVSSALRQGERSVALADRSGDAFQRFSKRTTLAAALHASGKLGPALAAFREAEAMQTEDQPEDPLLYSLWGYRYCDLLLDEVETRLRDKSGRTKDEGQDSDGSSLRSRLREVRNRAESTLKYRDEGWYSLLDIALDHLTLCLTYLAEAALRKSAVEAAEHHLNESVSLLRQAGDQVMLPRGLLQRAGLWRVRFEISNEESEISKAERDLAEAETIAERGSMRLWQIEAALERCRLALALAAANAESPGSNQGRPEGGASETPRTQSEWIEQARHKLAEARERIRQTEKPCEPHVPDWLEWQPPAYIGVFQKGDIVGYHCRNDEIKRLQQVIDQMA